MQVDEDLIAMATALYESDYSVNRCARYLHTYGKYLQDVSGIDCQNWDLQKLATALKLLSYPKEKIETGTSDEVNSNAIEKYIKLTAVHLLKIVSMHCEKSLFCFRCCRKIWQVRWCFTRQSMKISSINGHAWISTRRSCLPVLLGIGCWCL